MKNLFQPQLYTEIKLRLSHLQPSSQPQWGKMNVSQMMVHCSKSFGLAMGDAKPPRMLMGRIFGRLVKQLALKDDQPMRKNSPTVTGLEITDEYEFKKEHDHLASELDRFFTKGPTQTTTHPHGFFGKLTPEEWAILMYKHMDHHLRQFGV